MSSALDSIIVRGAREHNLKNIDLSVPKNKLVVFTGVSGSGKSSMAMDTIYAEGQRRYVESLSAYARQFLGVMGKPDLDSIEGLSPAIAIDQKTTSKNPRSTVGTITEVYDFMRLLYARVGHPHCPSCSREISRQSIDQISTQIVDILSSDKDFKTSKGVRYFIFAPVVKDRKGEFNSLFANLKKQGLSKARIDNTLYDLSSDIHLIKTNKHSIEAVVLRNIINKERLSTAEQKKDFQSRLHQTLETALRLANGLVELSIVKDSSFDFPEQPKEYEDHLFSENFACPHCNISLPEIEPRSFSFNSPHGACPSCDGLGTQLSVDEKSVLNGNLSIAEGGIFPWTKLFEHNSWTSMVIKSVAEAYNFSLNTPIKDLPKDILELVLFGPKEERKFTVNYRTKNNDSGTFQARYEGVIPNLIRRHKETSSDFIRNEIEKYMVKEPCPNCKGTRLKDEILSIVIDGKNIANASDMSIKDFSGWTKQLESKFNERERKISQPILKEINYRIKFLLDVGLGYLTLSRSSAHLSGGEAQRIRLASQIGTGLSGVLYVLDEPSIGLHARDQGKLIKTLKHLRDLGNTVLVVEHDTDTMLNSDYIIDFGPGAGSRGGEVIAYGTPEEIMKNKNSITGAYISGKKKVGQTKIHNLSGTEEAVEKKYKTLSLKGASGRNLKNIDFEIPLNKFVCVTGVSGSGKSTLIMDTLYTALRQYYGLKVEERPETFKTLSGQENIDKVVAIDQSPIGRTPKSNPATYTKVFDEIRNLFAQTPEAKVRGYKPGRFSFNVKGGRCEACRGEGQIKIEMQFMPDVYVNCEVCEGRRYNREALEIYYKEKNISEVLEMTVEEAYEFFKNIPQIRRRLEVLHDVGLGYIQLGQPAPTLSGGEAQRVKLSLELSKKARGNTLYILDEPTTGLHFKDLERLVSIMKILISRGHSILVIEHNLDIISNAEWVIDLGPDGGDKGGEVVFSGSLQDLLKDKKSYTAEALRKAIGQPGL
ncbi:excinuclease ABC subunit UvrA [Candidatus Nomurabacteria bacterium]|uniref:UvrABC system protein A n=1 Tax=candidate division WWE3 bacterium TaxID=2053526 RepID=A0A955DZN5_UNCKA|nr:excinuclease ABC subunit UvrA [candidate division WWE3 bacterium]MCB9824103.1 excinuclease ABC subunit UvrA [Candidatus Nomurabacteria bacterium]MCB9826926.1 excinuclease ABC subunit UvrA [Candidatus Nomurabacteria bacterium]MCB9828044.1 excinuclease ABC subunit UvrA [Candidatus Nomurabacteria bacterium]HXK52740.1 excinuclease ABC subunit UvrA [bacterium]